MPACLLFRSIVSLKVLCGAMLFSVPFLTTGTAKGDGGSKPADSPAASRPTARDLVLAPHAGGDAIDDEIRKVQERVRTQGNNGSSALKLGRLFISKARLADDPGYYRLAEQCGAAIEAKDPYYPDALLLRGHCLAAMHQFAAAEDLGRKLTAIREHFLDHGLLGDSLMEQGKLTEAIDAYQKMADLKPSMPVYARVAHIRWLKGDLAGAIEAAEEAIESSNPRDVEPLAWATNRLARYRWQEGNEALALTLVTRALELVPSYGPALLTRGLIYSGKGQFENAIPFLRTAAKIHPLPEYRWALIEALCAGGCEPEAEEVERLLCAKGGVDDPRGYALYEASTGHKPELALELAEMELRTRHDVFSHSALAWSLRAVGKTEAAAERMQLALREGTVDARLSLHAGVIFLEAGKAEKAAEYLARAESLRRMLHPSERRLLAEKQVAAGAQPTP
jgi:tetratricopeptide (TPR) repeat protein